MYGDGGIPSDRMEISFPDISDSSTCMYTEECGMSPLDTWRSASSETHSVIEMTGDHQVPALPFALFTVAESACLDCVEIFCTTSAISSPLLSCTAFALASHSRVRTLRPSTRRGAHSFQFWTAWTFATKVLWSVDAVVAFVGAAFAFLCASWAKRENVGEYCQGVNVHDFLRGGWVRVAVGRQIFAQR